MYKKCLVSHFVLFLTVFCALNVQAATIGLSTVTVSGDKMVNDSVLDVTWADTVPASLVSFYAGPNSCCYAGSAQQWVTSLNDVNYGGHNDWRLASLSPKEDVTNCIPGSIDEMGCLFNNELGAAYGQAVTYFGPFTALTADQGYWSGTESLISPTIGEARFFWTGYASRGSFPEGYHLETMAVRSGQTLEAPPPVTPIPATLWLLLSSVGVLGMFGRIRAQV